MIATPAVCYPHGHSPGARVVMCVQHLPNDRCNLIWKWRVSDSLVWHQFGGVVPCGKPIRSDPGDRRPK